MTDVKNWNNTVKLFDKALIKKLSTRHVYDVEIEYPDDDGYCNNSFSNMSDAIRWIALNDGHKVMKKYGALYLRVFVDGKRINDEDLYEVVKLCKEYELTIKGN